MTTAPPTPATSTPTAPPSGAPSADRAGRLAGVAGAGLALGLAELAAGVVDGVTSPVDAVAAQIVPALPGSLVTWAIETLGASDRAVLGVVIVAAVLALGAVAGRLVARHRDAEAAAIFLGVSAVGALAGLADVGANLLASVVALVGAGAVGLATTRWLVRARAGEPASTPGEPPTSGADEPLAVVRSDGRPAGSLDRRGFLTAAAAVSAAATAAAAGGRALGRPRAIAPESVALASDLPTPDVVLPPAPAAASLDVSGLTPLFVPNDEFYRIDTAVTGPPAVDLASWRLRIHGRVREELTLDFRDLVDRGLVESDITIACVSNTVGGGLVGNARWTGVPLAPLLDEAGVRAEGTQVVGRSVDGFTVGFPIEAATDGRDAMIAVAMNGEPLPVAHGFPARLVVPGLYGYVSATKWLSDIELVGWDDFDAYWIERTWSKRGPVKTQSRIDTVVPARGSGGPVAGANVVAGVAWAPTRGIEGVEVRVDDGAWQPARLSEPLDLDTWVQWRADVDLAPGSHTIQVRATDGTGSTQPEPPVAEHPDGAEGWHELGVTV